MEVLLSGYSEGSRQPEIFRISFVWIRSQTFNAANQEVDREKLRCGFRWPYDVIQRVVSGIDVNSWFNLKQRTTEVLNAFIPKVESDLAANGHPLVIISARSERQRLGRFFKNWGGVTRLSQKFLIFRAGRH